MTTKGAMMIQYNSKMRVLWALSKNIPGNSLADLDLIYGLGTKSPKFLPPLVLFFHALDAIEGITTLMKSLKIE